MKSLLLICLSFCLSAIAVPVDPFGEVELIEPKNTNQRDPETGGFFPTQSGGFPVVIVRTEAGTNPFGGFPFGRRSPFGGFPFHSQFPEEVEEVDPELPVPGVGSILRSIFGVPHVADNNDDEVIDEQEVEEEKKENCGLLCTLIGDLNKIHTMVEDEIRKHHDDEQDNEQEEEETIFTSDNENADGNSTYTEKILPDGTIVKTNRTVVKSPEGLSFVFTQTTSFNNFNNNRDEEEKDQEEPVDEEIDIRTDDAIEEVEDQDEEDEDDSEVPLLIDEFPEAGENEISDDEVGADDDDDDGIDGGLLEIVE